MKRTNLLFAILSVFSFSALASAITVQVSSPANGGTVSAPVSIVAKASSGHRITGWWIYVDQVGVWSTGATPSISPQIAMSAGKHSVTVRAWNSTGAYSSANLSLTVGSSTSALAITTSALPSSTVNAAYQTALAATGGTTPYVWSVASGQLPSGLALSASGVISGTPTSSGSFTFTAQAKDAVGQIATRSESLTVATTTVSPIVLKTNSLPAATLGVAYSATLAASGGTAPYTWSVVSGQLPAGLALSTAGVISGKPTALGSSSFSVQVKDSASSPQAATGPETISVSNPSSLSVQVSGNHLTNQDGQTVHLIGFGHQGSEYMCMSFNQTFDDPNSFTTTPQNMKAWGAGVNIARIPLNEDCWLGINGAVRGGSAYQNDILSFVNNLHKSGMYAELELHWSAPGSTPAKSQQVMADYDHSIAFWQSVATVFKSDPAVTFNLYNEPHNVSWACWKSGGSSCVYGFRIAGMEEMTQAIRNAEGTGWHHPIVVPGLGWSNDLSGWLTNRPADSANQQIAGIHTYDDGAGGAGGCPGTQGGAWNQNNCATSIFGGIKAAGFPIMITEMGDLSAGGCAYSTYLDSALKWMDANGDGYEPWAWGPFGCSNPSLLTDWNGTPVSGYGTGVKSHMQSLPTVY